MDKNVFFEVVRFENKRPVLIWQHTDSSSRPIPSHWHLDVEINFLDDGEGGINYYINGRHEVLKKGGVCFINSGEVHSCIPTIKNELGFTLIISYEFLKNIIPAIDQVYWRVENAQAQDKIIEFAHEILRVYQKKDTDMILNIKLAGLVCSIMTVFCESCMHQVNDAYLEDQRNSERMRGILEYIHTNYQYPLTQEAIARQFYFSRGYFSGFFKKYTGKTFKTYLTEVRLLHAEQMLKETGRSISQIAQDTGFNDERRLIETFKKYYHVTPGCFRKRILSAVEGNHDK